MKTLTITFPDTAHIPKDLEANSEHLRYLIAGSLYTQGILSGKEARELTGDDRRKFEEKMTRYGFPLMPSRKQDILAELNA